MASMSGLKIFIDPGHNKKWTGANRNGLLEHEVVLDIANACNAQLKSYGAVTMMSRTNHEPLNSVDLNADLDARKAKSNAFGAFIFVSIHNNAIEGDSPSATGMETFVRVGASAHAKNLAAKVNSTVAARTGLPQRPTPVRESNLRVITSDNKAFSILTEVGFLSHLNDVQKLNTLAKRQTAGKAIAEGIRSFVLTLPEQ